MVFPPVSVHITEASGSGKLCTFWQDLFLAGECSLMPDPGSSLVLFARDLVDKCRHSYSRLYCSFVVRSLILRVYSSGFKSLFYPWLFMMLDKFYYLFEHKLGIRPSTEKGLNIWEQLLLLPLFLVSIYCPTFFFFWTALMNFRTSFQLRIYQKFLSECNLIKVFRVCTFLVCKIIYQQKL